MDGLRILSHEYKIIPFKIWKNFYQEDKGSASSDFIYNIFTEKATGIRPKAYEKISNTPVISKEQKWLESIPKEVKGLAEKLEWRTGYLIKLLEQKNIHKKETDELTPEEIISIKEMLKARHKGIMRNKKTIKGKGSYLKKLKKLNNVVYDDSVYGKMALYGVGKMIYIRSK